MTAVELIELRKRLGLSQSAMADGVGLGLRGYQEVESREGELPKRHVLMAERFALAKAAEMADQRLLPSSVLRDVLAIANAIKPAEHRSYALARRTTHRRRCTAVDSATPYRRSTHRQADAAVGSSLPTIEGERPRRPNAARRSHATLTSSQPIKCASRSTFP
jgi:transcriptional regulator with XRE-family HTH domain